MREKVKARGWIFVGRWWYVFAGGRDEIQAERSDACSAFRLLWSTGQRMAEKEGC
jgi:hypothetical protein